MKASRLDSAPSRFAVALGALCLTCAFAAGARAAATSPGDDTATQTDAQAASIAVSELMEHHRHHHHGGVTQFIAMSLDTLGVPDTKRPGVDKVQSDLHACMAPAKDIEGRLLTTIADGVAAGTIDTEKVDANIVQLDAAATTVHDCSADALNRLHGLLSHTERVVLVDKVQAHWDVWRHVNHEAEMGGKEQGGRLADLAIELTLTTDQIAKMSTALEAGRATLTGKFEPKKVNEHVQAFSTAFVRKSFDAHTLTANANGHIATCGSRRTALFYETVTPLLTPEQRTTLAQHLREHATQPLASSGK